MLGWLTYRQRLIGEFKKWKEYLARYAVEIGLGFLAAFVYLGERDVNLDPLLRFILRFIFNSLTGIIMALDFLWNYILSSLGLTKVFAVVLLFAIAYAAGAIVADVIRWLLCAWALYAAYGNDPSIWDMHNYEDPRINGFVRWIIEIIYQVVKWTITFLIIYYLMGSISVMSFLVELLKKMLEDLIFEFLMHLFMPLILYLITTLFGAIARLD
jgi:hypothetical protein